jgi:hypothetical protein
MSAITRDAQLRGLRKQHADACDTRPPLATIADAYGVVVPSAADLK